MEAIPLDDFNHGSIKAKRDVPIEVSEALALDLERAGLVRIKAKPDHANKMMLGPPENKGNTQAAGVAQQSSASPVAQASTPTTAAMSTHGARRGRPPGK